MTPVQKAPSFPFPFQRAGTVPFYLSFSNSQQKDYLEMVGLDPYQYSYVIIVETSFLKQEE